MATRFVDFERRKLYEQVWAQPLGQVAETYGVGNAEVKHAAAVLAVPLPPPGHWTKVEHGKGIATPPLPEFDGETTYRHTWWVNDETEEVERRFAQTQGDAAPTSAALPPLSTSIGECLPIIKKMAARLKKGHKDTRNWPSVGGYQGMFEVSVSPDNQERALLTLDRVLRHCLAAGLKFTSNETAREPAYFVIDGTELTLRIFESGRREEREPTPEEKAKLKANLYVYRPDRYIYHPTNVLRLEVHHKGYHRAEFTIVDSADLPLAKRIHDVPARLRERALKDKLLRDIRAEEREREAARRAAYERKAERKRKELERLKHFEDVASQLERATRLRLLADGMEQCGRFDDTQGLEKVAWIRHAANWLDPLLDTRWPAVDDVRDTYY